MTFEPTVALLFNGWLAFAFFALVGVLVVYAIYFFSDFWAPITMLPQLEAGFAASMQSRDSRDFRVIGRLRPGASTDGMSARSNGRKVSDPGVITCRFTASVLAIATGYVQ